MDKKVPLARKTSPITSQQTQQQSTTFKNENVIFKIHSPKGQQNYNAKTFPAKFSINICNQPTQLSTGLYNREPTQHSFPIPMLSSTSKNDFEAVKTERVSPNFDFDQYQKQIKAILQDKKKCDQLIRQLEQTCEQYQYQNQDLVNSLNQASAKIQENSQRISEKQRVQQDLKEFILKLKYQNKELKQKIKYLENQIKKHRQNLASRINSQQFQIQKLQKKINQLQQVIKQKELTIKNISNFNNQIAKKLLDEQSYSSSSHVKKMQKWLKLMNRKYQTENSNMLSTQNQQSMFVTELLMKCQKMSNKVNELEQIAHFLDVDFKQAVKQNQALTRSNEDLKNTIKDLRNSLQQVGKDTQQSFFKKTFNQGGTIIYQGTIKVKMETLLIEKDKRINALEQQVMESKKQNSALKTKIYQLDLQRGYLKETFNIKEDYSLKKAKSLQNFYHQTKNDNQVSPREKEDRQLNKIIFQFNDLTQTLGNFMETYKSQRSVFQQRRKSRFSQSYQPNFCSRDQNKDKIQQIVELQKATYDMLQRNLKKQPISFEQTKWNNNRYLDLSRLQKQNSRGFQFQNPITERISRQDFGFRRTQRCQKSCFLNQDR